MRWWGSSSRPPAGSTTPAAWLNEGAWPPAERRWEVSARDRLEKLAGEIEERGGSALVIRADVTGAITMAQAPAPWKRRPTKKPTAAAPRPIATIFAPLFRQSPTSVTAE